MSFGVRQFGVRGSAVIVIDRRDGRYVRRIADGPASSAEGYDGRNIWIADAANNTYLQGNADTRAEVLRWSQLLRDFVDGKNKRTAHIRVGDDTQNVTISPTSIRIANQEGTTELRLSTMQRVSHVDASTFEPPAPPNDAAIDDSSGIAEVPMLPLRVKDRPSTLVVVPVSVDGSQPMHFLLDTGGQNILTPAAARRLHLTILGNARTGGAGSGTIATSYAWVRSMRVGTAYLRHQPFMILPLEIVPGIDGIVGAELLSRFAARFDFAKNELALARKAPPFWFQRGNVSALAFNLNMPDMAGSIDGFPGRFTLDTGSDGSLDINAPFARRHNLGRTYSAIKRSHFAGVGGTINTAEILARVAALGSLVTYNIPATLALDSAGVSGDPTTAGNVGELFFRNYTLTIDYATRRINFESPR
ncbi:MAG TPA: pepsin/retropepsin-like aspartic protease family protein [Candidatus Tumulicola sp.]